MQISAVLQASLMQFLGTLHRSIPYFWYIQDGQTPPLPPLNWSKRRRTRQHTFQELGCMHHATILTFICEKQMFLSKAFKQEHLLSRIVIMDLRVFHVHCKTKHNVLSRCSTFTYGKPSTNTRRNITSHRSLFLSHFLLTILTSLAFITR